MDDKYEFSVKLGGNTQELILQNFEKEISWEDEIQFLALENSKALHIIQQTLNAMTPIKERLRIKVRVPYIVSDTIQCDILNIKITREIKGYSFQMDGDPICELTYKQIINEIKCAIHENDIIGIFTKDLKDKKSIEKEIK